MKMNNTRSVAVEWPVSQSAVDLPLTRPSSEASAEVPELNLETIRPEGEEEPRRGVALDAFTLYMREVGQTKLITREEEIDLAKRIKKGDKAAREQMIKANLRLVVKIARDYESSGLPLLDLVSEGNMGLMTAVERFDPKKGAKLSTYAAFWIKQSIRRALANQSKTIRLPVHVVDKLFHMRRAEARFRIEMGRDPSDVELSQELGISVKRIASYRSASVVPSSLDALMGDSGDSGSFSEIVPDEKAQTPYRNLEEKTDTALIRDIVQSLDEREQAILKSRFGLDGDEEETLDVIGHKFGVTRERIRQIQEMALTKLRRKLEKMDNIQQMSA